MLRLVVACSLVLAALGHETHADRRSFTNTYEYSTVPEGKTALELWSTQGRRTWDRSSPQFYEQILEIEHGLTDHWDMAYYTVLSQVAGDAMTSEPLHLDEIKLETRYRLADRGEWPVDATVDHEQRPDRRVHRVLHRVAEVRRLADGARERRLAGRDEVDRLGADRRQDPRRRDASGAPPQEIAGPA